MSSDGAHTPQHEQPGADLSALKTLVEVSLGLSTLAAGSAHSREGTPGPLSPTAARFDPSLSIVVIGMRGVGKTTLGIIIATYLSRPFIDADRVFERVFGSSIAALVSTHGWAYFREREAHVLQQLLRAQGRGQVIVLGGGVVETASNRELLRAHTRKGGVVIHVGRPMEEVFQYLQRQGTKSTWAAFEEEGRVIWNRRLAWYESCSNLSFVSLARSTASRTHPSLALKHVESAIQRLVRSTLALPTPLERFSLSARSCALVLTGRDLALSDASELELVSRGADVLELRVDTLPSHYGSTPSTPSSTSPPLPPSSLVPTPAPSAPNADPFHAALAFGFLRQSSPLPLLWTVRSTAQGGQYVGPRAAYLELVQAGLRLASDFVDVELALEDDEIERLLQGRGPGTRVVLSWCWAGEAPAWDDDEVRRVYDRAVRLGADVVRLSMVARSPLDNFKAAELQSSIEAEGGPPLIALNTGQVGRLSILLNERLSPISHPRLSTRGIDHREVQSGLRIIGLERQRTIWDDGSRAGTSEFVRAGVSDLGLSFELCPLPTLSSLASVLTDAQFGGAILSTCRTTSLPSGITLDPSAALTGWTDMLSHSSLNLPTAYNSRAIAIRSILLRHLSPVNLVGRWTSALVVDLSGADARQVGWALGSMGVGTIFSVQSQGLDGDERQVVSCGDLDEVVRRAASRGPTIVVCGRERVELPVGMRDSSTGGVVLALGGKGGTEDGGWIVVGPDELDLAVGQACFATLTGKRSPGVSTI